MFQVSKQKVIIFWHLHHIITALLKLVHLKKSFFFTCVSCMFACRLSLYIYEEKNLIILLNLIEILS